MAPVLQPLFHAGIQPYLIDLFSYDPADVARSWQGPVLIIQGMRTFRFDPMTPIF